jgi:hypothetical protein
MSPYGKLVEPTDYLEVTRKDLRRCGPDAKVGQIWETMRDEGTPVGYWLNPCLIYLDPERFGHLKVSKNRVPHGTPVKIVEHNGELKVVGRDGKIIG